MHKLVHDANERMFQITWATNDGRKRGMTAETVDAASGVQIRAPVGWEVSGVQVACQYFILYASNARPWLGRLLRALAGRGGVRQSAMLVALLLLFAGCASTAPVQRMYQTLAASMRKPGEKMVRTLEETQKEYSCAAYRKPVFKLEEVQVLPEIVTRGKEINQRLRYAFCPSTPAETLRGNVRRTVHSNGKVIFSDTASYEFKPGTWIIDAFIGVPEQARNGVYGADVVLQWKNQRLKGSGSFVVRGT
jgi:hypothetical protein